MKLALIAAAVVLSLGTIECAKEGTGPDARAGTTTITSQEEQAPQGTNAAAFKAENITGTQPRGANVTGTGVQKGSAASATEGPREVTAPPGPPKTGAEHHGQQPRFVPPPRPSDTGDPPPPPDQRRR